MKKKAGKRKAAENQTSAIDGILSGQRLLKAAEPRLGAEKGAVTIYVNKEKFRRFKDLAEANASSASELIDKFIELKLNEFG